MPLNDDFSITMSCEEAMKFLERLNRVIRKIKPHEDIVLFEEDGKVIPLIEEGDKKDSAIK